MGDLDLETYRAFKESDKGAAIDPFIRIRGYFNNIVYRIALVRVRDSARAEDVCQEVFTAVWSKREECPLDHSRAWILKIASFKAVDCHRKNAKTVQLAAEPQVKDDFTEKSADAELIELVGREIDSLPIEQRNVIKYLLIEGLSLVDIKVITGRSLAVIIRLRDKGLATLRRRLGRHFEHLKGSEPE